MDKDKWTLVGTYKVHPQKKQSKLQRLKYKIKARYIMWHCHRLIKKGYLATDGEPLKCTRCNSNNLERYNEYWGECHGPIIEEYSIRCKECKQHLGTNSYGSWDTW